jgi:hypothetical protein
VRKAFDAGKDESQPAVVSVVNIAKGGVSAYLSRTVAEGTDTDGNETYSVRLWTVLKGEAAKNFIDDTNSVTVSVFVTPSIIRKGTTSLYPGESLTIGDVTLAYYPCTGPEYIEKLKIGTVAPPFHGLDWLLRIEGLMSIGVSGQGEIDGPVQIVAETGRRWRLQGLDTIADGSLYFVSLTATVWLDDARRVGVGMSFDTGRTPTTNFIAQRRNSIGLQLKF